MTAAVEEVSRKCQLVIQDLDAAFSAFKAAAETALSPSDKAGPNKTQETSGRKRTEPSSITRKLRSSGRVESPQGDYGLSSSVKSKTKSKRAPGRQLRSNDRVEASQIKEEGLNTPELKIKLTRSLKAEVGTTSSKKPKRPNSSPYFPTPKPPPTTKFKTSCVPLPPLSSPTFGLIQERLHHNPFQLLLATIFLNKTRGSVAIPVFYKLLTQYPTPADLAAANHADVVALVLHLGLQNQRATKYINLANAWLDRPPDKAKRYRVLHYPCKNDGKDITPSEILPESDERVGWEVGQLPGIGAYAIDSWRIFCHDDLRGLDPELPDTINGEGKVVDERKEWTRVLPLDKELRAYLRWRWLKCGWDWNPISGVRERASEEQMEAARQGGVVREGDEGDAAVVAAKEG